MKKKFHKMNGYDEEMKFSNTSSRRRSIKDENLLKKAEKLLFIEGRVIKIPILDENEEEDEMILLTNLPYKIASTYEIAGLYKDRWEIEVNYDRLKNKMDLENYSGKLELTISQDFYSSIYIYNLAMIVRTKIQEDLERKNNKKRKTENKEYRTNINILMGRLRKRLIELFTSSTKKIKRIIGRIIKRGLKTTYLYDFNRPKINWHRKIFIGKFRFNQRKNV